MSNKKQNPLIAAASFKSVSNPPELSGISKKKVEIKDESNIKSNDDVKRESNVKSILDDVPDFNETPKKRPLTVYLDQEVWDALDQFAKPKGKGAKSDLLNKLLKNTFEVK